MRSQDLLDQGRARSRHADDEDRIAGRMTLTLASGKELRSEAGPELLDVAERIGHVVANRLPFQRIARLIVTKSQFALTFVIKCLAERKVDAGSMNLRQLAAFKLGQHHL